MLPPQEICAMQDMFCFAALANAITGPMNTDITSAFPVCSFKSMQYVFVAYIYDLNAIIVRAMPSCTDASMEQAFTKAISVLKSGGYHPALNIMDNKFSAAVKKYIRSKAIIIQLVPPHNHRTNAAERAIATFKEHFITTLATVDMLFPLQLWDDFFPQVKLTLNMLCFSQQNPKKSANQEVYGSFDFNKTPLAPLGTKALVYDNPGSQTSWVPHATNGFYVGPASDHYQCLQFYIPAMRRFRFSNTWRLYPAHCQVPGTLQHDLSIAAAADLIKVFGGTVPKMSADNIKHIRAIRELTAIMAGQQTDPPTVDAPTLRVVAPCSRMATTPPPRAATTSNNIMTPNVIRQMPLIHQRHTRNNNPFHILTKDDDDDDTVIASHCNPSAPPTVSPSSAPPVNPPMRQEPRQLTIPPPIPPPSAPPMRLPTTPPPRVQGTRAFIPAITPTAPYSPIHDLCPVPSQKPTQPLSLPSSKPTPVLLLNLMTNRIVHQPQDHPANPDAPPVSSATRCHAISHARHCITSLTWDLLVPLPPQSLTNLSTINIQALLLKSKNTAME
jgi:hypothetical protein